jgi:hypothetical protein
MPIPQIPTRLLVALAAAVAALAAFLVARPLLVEDTSTEPVAVDAAPPPSRTAPKAPTAPARPRVQLLPGLPATLARELRFEKVVVVSVYAGKSAVDRTAVAAARSGAREVDAGFVALNVYDERKARSLGSFIGSANAPSVLVVRRPGRVVTQIDGFVDSAIVAQAAHNAGAGKSASR